MATYYLDVDDEITSAASRIRSAKDQTIAIVLPPGSRVATSRINFRLLAREAQAHDRRLSIVAPEAATRALAASAGLPVFATVSEYETAQSDGSRAVAMGAGGETAAALDELAATVTPSRRAAATATLDRDSRRPEPRRDNRPASTRVATPARRRRVPFAAIAFALIAALVVGGAGYAAYLFLPSASIVITPREDPIPPVQLTVKVDPNVQAPDQTALVAPGIKQNFPVDAHGTFDATGTKVNKTAASGIVTFSNKDTGGTVYVPAQTQVWTASGVTFLTQTAVTVPVANFDTHTLGTVNVAVTAKNAGNSGNVLAGAIVNMPASFGTLVSVSNTAAIAGGSETTTHLIAQSDVDAARATLGSQLNAAFNTKLTDPAQAKPGTQLFPDTSQLGAPAFDPDPATLVGQAVSDQQHPTFTLAATANGTATAADLGQVRALADKRVRGTIPAGRTLVENSLDVQLGQGVAAGTAVNVPITVVARTIAALDVNALRNAVKGKSPTEARGLLSQYGRVELKLSPDWIPNLPGNESQITIRIATTPPASPRPSSQPPGGQTTPPAASPSPSPTAPAAS